MTMITWKNIDAPDFSGALKAGQAASEQMGKALDPLKTILTDAQARDQANWDNTAEQTTQALAGQFRNASSIAELDQMANPEMIQQNYGALANLDKLKALQAEQEGVIRTQNTNAALTAPLTATTREGVFESVANLNPREVDREAILKHGLDRLNAAEADERKIQADLERTEANDKILREGAERDKEEALVGFNNMYLDALSSGGSGPESRAAILAQAKEKGNVDLFALSQRMNKATQEQQAIDPVTQRQIDSKTRHHETEYRREEGDWNDRLAQAQAQVSALDGQGVSSVYREQANKLPRGAVQAVADIVGKGDNGLRTVLTYLNNPALGLNSDDKNAILWQSFNEVPQGTKFGMKVFSDDAYTRAKELVSLLPRQIEAQSVLKDVEFQKREALSGTVTRYNQDVDNLYGVKQLQTNAMNNGVPISVQNNNPGNLVGKDGKFQVFKTAAEGEAALEKDLRGKLSGNSPAYVTRFGTLPVTPNRLTEVWSPAKAKGNSQESTTNYGKFVADALGISPDATIEDTSDNLAILKRAITAFESGIGSGDRPDLKADAASILRNKPTETTRKGRQLEFSSKPETPEESALSEAVRRREALDRDKTQKTQRKPGIIDTRGLDELGGITIDTLDTLINKPIQASWDAGTSVRNTIGNWAKEIHNSQQKRIAIAYLEQKYSEGRISADKFDSDYAAIKAVKVK